MCVCVCVLLRSPAVLFQVFNVSFVQWIFHWIDHTFRFQINNLKLFIKLKRTKIIITISFFGIDLRIIKRTKVFVRQNICISKRLIRHLCKIMWAYSLFSSRSNSHKIVTIDSYIKIVILSRVEDHWRVMRLGEKHSLLARLGVEKWS